ncbi:MAG: aldehyde dehydrogenase family protein [Terriglobales bacterium]
MARTFPFLIGGELVLPERPRAVRSPYSGDEVGRAGDATGLEMTRALEAGAGARGAMAALPGYRRREALLELERGVAAAQDELAELMAREAAKPLRDARVEVGRARVTLRTAAEEAARMGGEWQPLDVAPGAEGRIAIARRFPRGLIAGITPFNFPLNLVLHKLAPALAAGNSIIIKASPRTPLTALRLGELAQGLDLPAGAVNIVAGGAESVEPLLADERVAMISFTGSAGVGWPLRARAGDKHVTLELGGNAANIVHSDADLDWAAERIAAGGFGYAGQSCISAQRLLVQQGVYGAVRERLVARAQALRLGDPLDPATDVGPMITDEAAARAEGWIQEAVAGGAHLLCGGQRDGGFLTPAVLDNVRPEMSVCREEAFAPLLVLAPYDSAEEAFAAANASRYGLQAGIFTRNWDLVWQAFRALEVGGVVVNDASSSRVEPMPYGGVKQSGQGREGLRAAIEDMTELRVLLAREASP